MAFTMVRRSNIKPLQIQKSGSPGNPQDLSRVPPRETRPRSPRPFLPAEKTQLVAQRKAVRHLLRIRLVKRFTKFAAVDLGVFADPRLHVLGIVVPALQMSRAQFAFGVLLIARPLPGFAHLELLLGRRNHGRGRDGRCGRNCGRRRRRCRRCCALRCSLLGHAGVPLFLEDARLRTSGASMNVSYSNPSRETKRHC